MNQKELGRTGVHLSEIATQNSEFRPLAGRLKATPTKESERNNRGAKKAKRDHSLPSG
jgi:hypothetical protein